MMFSQLESKGHPCGAATDYQYIILVLDLSHIHPNAREGGRLHLLIRVVQGEVCRQFVIILMF